MDPSEARVALIIPSGNGPYSFNLLNRLLQSLVRSDFPRKYQVFMPVSDDKESKAEALKQVVSLDSFDYAVVMHNDFYFAGPFWQAMIGVDRDLVYGTPLGPSKKPLDYEFLCVKTRFAKEHPVAALRDYMTPAYQPVEVKIPVCHDRTIDREGETNAL